jgi:membrane protein
MPDDESRVSRVRRFLTEGVWDVELRSLSGLRRFGVSTIRVVHLVLRGFRDDQCPLHASALTFYTLMSLVPVLALSLSIAKGFGAGEVVEKQIRTFVREQLRQFDAPAVTNQVDTIETDEATAPQANATALNSPPLVVDAQAITNAAESLVTGPDPAASDADPPAANDVEDIVTQVEAVIDEIFGYVNNVSFGALSGVGLVLLIWSVIAGLGRVELSFNRVWGVATQRNIFRKFTDYLGVLVLTPILIVLSSSLPAVELAYKFLPAGVAGSVLSVLESDILKHIAMLMLVALSFAIFMMIMPNTRVRFAPAFCGGTAAAILFIAWIWICIRLQVGVARQGAVYGSFAILPILLLWVLVSWQIILLGTEIAFAVQNCATYRMEQTARRASTESRVLLAMAIISEAIRTVQDRNGAFDAAEYAQARQIPVRLLNEVLDELVTAGFVAAIAGQQDHYALLRAPDDVRKKDVVEAMMRAGAGPRDLGLEGLREESDRLLAHASDDDTGGTIAHTG